MGELVTAARAIWDVGRTVYDNPEVGVAAGLAAGGALLGHAAFSEWTPPGFAWARHSPGLVSVGPWLAKEAFSRKHADVAFERKVNESLIEAGEMQPPKTASQARKEARLLSHASSGPSQFRSMFGRRSSYRRRSTSYRRKSVYPRRRVSRYRGMLSRYRRRR